ncbi:hypothetical protein PQX77_018753 [Marasmius sp. AFHP31]|nr:hypothetical protein PQX77_018753 [Marasmius sp. AFHP31]
MTAIDRSPTSDLCSVQPGARPSPPDAEAFLNRLLTEYPDEEAAVDAFLAECDERPEGTAEWEAVTPDAEAGDYEGRPTPSTPERSVTVVEVKTETLSPKTLDSLYPMDCDDETERAMLKERVTYEAGRSRGYLEGLGKRKSRRKAPRADTEVEGKGSDSPVPACAACVAKSLVCTVSTTENGRRSCDECKKGKKHCSYNRKRSRARKETVARSSQERAEVPESVADDLNYLVRAAQVLLNHFGIPVPAAADDPDVDMWEESPTGETVRGERGPSRSPEASRGYESRSVAGWEAEGEEES